MNKNGEADRSFSLDVHVRERPDMWGKTALTEWENLKISEDVLKK